MSTFIHGIAASENIDSSGERVIISGMDISSLAVDGVFNYEHKKDQPSQIVGKILGAKKIFSEADCDNDHHMYFWNKARTPFVYVMGELMDDYKESAKEVAGMFRYDADRKDKQERNVMNFSVEGVYVAKAGIDVIRSIARKITLTVLPCNKAAIAEMVPATATKKDELDDIFKTESIVEIEVMNLTQKMQAIEMIKSERLKKDLMESNPSLGGGSSDLAPGSPGGLLKADAKLQPIAPALAKPVAPAKPKLSLVTPHGIKIGYTKSGKTVNSHTKVGDYADFSAQDHRDAATAHHNAAQVAKAPGLARHHMDKFKLHSSKANTIQDRIDRSKPLKKTLCAGSGLGAAPSQLTQGAALAKESLDKKIHKNVWLDKADELYKNWDKREQFVQFMQKKMPKLLRGEIDAIGRVLVLKKKWKDQIPGGLADKKTPKDFDPESLKDGIKVELEHTSDHKIATEIAMDHLTEDPQYYVKLKTIEKSSNLKSE